jgi:SRSO17 transposase
MPATPLAVPTSAVPVAASAEPDPIAVHGWAAALGVLAERIGRRFARAEPRQRVLAYLQGLLSPVERKNGWQLAEAAGEASPAAVQHLLGRAVWDADAVRDDLRAYVVEHLGDPGAVLVVDETGFPKKGTKSVGVQRQYSGTAGRIENCQLGVFLAYAGAAGRAFLDRDLYLPREWAADAARRAAAGVPARIDSRTKPELARAMLERALDAGVPAGWVAGDEVYGGDRRLRVWLEERNVPHVLAVKRGEPLWAATARGPAQVKAEDLAAAVPAEAWVRPSAGDGAKGPRLYDWARAAIRPLADPDRGYWLLARRRVADPTDLAYYVCYGPAAAGLAALARVAGMRWAIEEGIEAAKGEVGLDRYEVRRWDGWYRHVTLGLLAHAFLAATRAGANAGATPAVPPRPAGAWRRSGRGAASGAAEHSRDQAPLVGAGLGLAAAGGVRARPVPLAARPPSPGQTQPLPAPRHRPARSTTVVLVRNRDGVVPAYVHS